MLVWELKKLKYDLNTKVTSAEIRNVIYLELKRHHK